MKYIIRMVLPVLCLVLVMNACKKTQNNPVLTTTNAKNTLTSSVSSVVLDSTKLTATIVSFSWDSVNYNVKYPVTYVVEIDTFGHNFSTASTFPEGTGVYSCTFTTVALNALALKLKDSTTGVLQVRVLSFVQTGSFSYDSVYSNVISLNVTPYIPAPVILPASTLYIVGDYMSWSWPPTGVNNADSLSSPNSDGKYSGFAMIIGGTGSDQFKLCTSTAGYNGAFADANIGMETTTGNVSTITMNTAGGTTNNLFVPQSGLYYMVADTNALLFTATYFTSVTASGTALGSSSVTFSYDTTAHLWVDTTSLSAGSIQFTLNGTPTTNNITFAAGTTANSLIMGGTTGVTVSTGGTYRIVLNLGVPQSYSDTLTKL